MVKGSVTFLWKVHRLGTCIFIETQSALNFFQHNFFWIFGAGAVVVLRKIRADGGNGESSLQLTLTREYMGKRCS